MVLAGLPRDGHGALAGLGHARTYLGRVLAGERISKAEAELGEDPDPGEIPRPAEQCTIELAAERRIERLDPGSAVLAQIEIEVGIARSEHVEEFRQERTDQRRLIEDLLRPVRRRPAARKERDRVGELGGRALEAGDDIRQRVAALPVA